MRGTLLLPFHPARLALTLEPGDSWAFMFWLLTTPFVDRLLLTSFSTRRSAAGLILPLTLEESVALKCASVPSDRLR